MESLSIWAAFIAHDLSQFVTIVGLIYVIVNVIMAAWLKNRKIQPAGVTYKQVRRELSYSFLTVVIFSSMGWLVHYGFFRPFMLLYTDIHTYSFGIPGFGWFYVGLSLIATIVVHDAYFYWMHRLMHHRLLYRHVHRLHHRSITPAPTTAYAFAPGEALLHAAFLPLILLIVPLHPVAIGLFTMVMIARNTLAHTGIEVFPAGFVTGVYRWNTTVTHHDLHHLHGAGNYGFYFTWWDRMMRTERKDYESSFRKITEAGTNQYDASRVAGS